MSGETKVSGGRFDERKDGFAERPRLSEFREAPFTVKPVLGENQYDCFRAGNFSIELALPVRARRKARMFIEVEKGFRRNRWRAATRAGSPLALRPGWSG